VRSLAGNNGQRRAIGGYRIYRAAIALLRMRSCCRIVPAATPLVSGGRYPVLPVTAGQVA
jgi:hypothetical protein